MMKITTINNALTFCIFFPTKGEIHSEPQGEQGGSCCNFSIAKDYGPFGKKNSLFSSLGWGGRGSGEWPCRSMTPPCCHFLTWVLP